MISRDTDSKLGKRRYRKNDERQFIAIEEARCLGVERLGRAPETRVVYSAGAIQFEKASDGIRAITDIGPLTLSVNCGRSLYYQEAARAERSHSHNLCGGRVDAQGHEQCRKSNKKGGNRNSESHSADAIPAPLLPELLSNQPLLDAELL